ncbi:hypothetical protein C8J57DRAFT_462004 [Mycena rebaudengoi]|nr:hypothetical protein C8J57DRAFT_1378197 [Mycena rebaudengoi]KAJ7262089.1 hypothetical protein C8J57DRAFT_462004 [Mycena rebaudengoi]
MSRWPIRLNSLPYPLQVLVHARLYSSQASNAGQYKFPTGLRPTPHQIFHLPHGASQEDIKARYIDLVKLHHPDSPRCRDIPATERHRRFQSISSAYDSLRNKSSAAPDRDEAVWEELRRRKRAHTQYRHSRHAEYARGPWTHTASADGRWKDHVILSFGFVALMAGLLPVLVYPRHPLDRSPVSAAHLSEARRDARRLYEARISELEGQAEKPINR